MSGDPIDLNRGEVRQLWDFMVEVKTTLRRVEVVLDDHEERIRVNHEELVTQRSERALTRWVLPVVISLGAMAVSVWSLVKQTNGD